MGHSLHHMQAYLRILLDLCWSRAWETEKRGKKQNKNCSLNNNLRPKTEKEILWICESIKKRQKNIRVLNNYKYNVQKVRFINLPLYEFSLYIKSDSQFQNVYRSCFQSVDRYSVFFDMIEWTNHLLFYIVKGIGIF